MDTSLKDGRELLRRDVASVETWLRSGLWVDQLKPMLEERKRKLIEQLCTGTQGRDEDQLLRGAIREVHRLLQQPGQDRRKAERQLKQFEKIEQDQQDPAGHQLKYGWGSPYVNPDESGDEDG